MANITDIITEGLIYISPTHSTAAANFISKAPVFEGMTDEQRALLHIGVLTVIGVVYIIHTIVHWVNEQQTESAEKQAATNTNAPVINVSGKNNTVNLNVTYVIYGSPVDAGLPDNKPSGND